jgi:hypothetical protein
MHGTYVFLLDSLDGSLLDGELGREAIRHFEHRYADSLTDENNWWSAEGLVTVGGRAVNLAKESDWRDRDSFLAGVLEAAPPESLDVADRVRAMLVNNEGCLPEAFQSALRWTWQVVALDMGLWGASSFALAEKGDAEARVARASPMELEKALLAEIPARLGAAYTALGAGTVLSVDHNAQAVHTPGEWLMHYRRRNLARTFELLHNAALRPFSDTLTTPYDNYRAFDIRDDRSAPSVTPDSGILFVDIHT